jgi:hypothetical protein
MNKLFGGLRRPPINDNAHANQPKTGADNGEEKGEEARLSGSKGGGCISIALAVKEWPV